MEEAELNHYVSQLKGEFDSCDTTATGFLDRDELTELCRKLQLDAHLVVDTLLGGGCYNRVNFEEFKEGFVAVLSRSLDFSTSEDDSSYLEPVVPEEVKPKFVKGTKRYGRRSRPEDAALLPTGDPENPSASRTEEDLSPPGIRRAKVRRSTSLESVESLKSDEEAGSQKENILPDLQSKGTEEEEEQEEELEVAGGDQLALQQLSTEDLDGRVGVGDFQKVLCGSAPFSCSTPVRSADLQVRRSPHVGLSMHRSSGLISGCGLLTWVRTDQTRTQTQTQTRTSCCTQSQASEERSLRTTPPSLLTATVGQRVLSRLDEGSGCTSTERVVALWTEEGIRNARDILQTLDFPLEERLSLADLTLALDSELLVSGTGIEQAALISYKNEIQHLQVLVDQACSERDKVKTDLDQAHQRNLQLVREVDDRHASMETLNQSRIRQLEQDLRDRLAALRWQSQQESEAELQQTDRERRSLQDRAALRVQEAELREELCGAAQESRRLQEDLRAATVKLTEAERSVKRLQRDLDQLLLHKFGGFDPAAAGLSHEERFSEIVKDYELQCRELRDRNDELSSEVELLKSQRSDRKSRRSAGDEDALTWNQQRPVSSDSDEADMKRSSSPQVRKKLQPADRTALCSLDQVSGLRISIQTELALEQLKQKHNQELQQLHIQLETQVNYYERSLEVMRQSMEVERKDISQAFKMEISELEEQKSQAEQQVKQLKETLEKLSSQLQRGGGGGGGWSHEQERRMQREGAELEQNFAREIGNLVQRLSSEKDQLEAELKLKADQEVMLVRTQLEEVRLENAALQQRLSVLQQEVTELEDHGATNRRRVDEMERDHERSREEEERLHKENSRHREEVLDLSSRNLKLSNDNAELSAQLRGDQESVRMLRQRLETVSKEKEEEETTKLQQEKEKLQQEKEKLQQEAIWTQEREQLDRQTSCYQEKVTALSCLEAELSAVTVKLQSLEEEKDKLLREAEEQNNKVEALQRSLLSMEEEAELLCSQTLGHAQEVSGQQRKVEELQSSVRKLVKEKEELHQALDEQEEQEETHKLRVQNQELQHQLSELQVQSLEVQKLNQEQQNLKTRLSELQTERTQAQDQAELVQVQHLRRLQEVQRQAGDDHREQEELLRARLEEEQRRSHQLEETLRLQAQQSSSHISMKQDQYEKALSSLQRRMEDLESTLKGVRLVLQEKVQQLKEQLVKNSKTSCLLKDVYVENSELMKALQVTEQRQKHAEKKNLLLEDKVTALNKLLRDVVTATLP
ncbi:LOW QUALITY PROTEIN: ninein-like protein [Lycodopsis pacificus]